MTCSKTGNMNCRDRTEAGLLTPSTLPCRDDNNGRVKGGVEQGVGLQIAK